MMGLFSLDSIFMQFMSRLCDLIIPNLLFLLTCLPIITIGAASTALYTVCFRMGTEREEGCCGPVRLFTDGIFVGVPVLCRSRLYQHPAA